LSDALFNSIVAIFAFAPCNGFGFDLLPGQRDNLGELKFLVDATHHLK
jgi:hypothetical protein